MICGSATEKMRTSDFRRRTSAGLRGRCIRRPRGACVARSLKSEVGSHHLVIAQGLSPVRLFLTQSRRGAEAAELCVRIYGGPVPVESYDAKSRRVKKVTPNATTTFFYDDWNLVEERIAYADNTTSTIRYYWGRGRKGKLRFIGQEDIVDEDDVDFSNAYDLTLYREEIIRVVKSMEKSLLEQLSKKVKEARK